jgi:hypothetical protein
MADNIPHPGAAAAPAGILDQLRAAALAWMAVPRVRHPRSRHLRPASRQHLAHVAGVSHPVVARLMGGRPIQVEQAEAVARAVGAEIRLVPVRSGVA